MPKSRTTCKFKFSPITSTNFQSPLIIIDLVFFIHILCDVVLFLFNLFPTIFLSFSLSLITDTSSHLVYHLILLLSFFTVPHPKLILFLFRLLSNAAYLSITAIEYTSSIIDTSSHLVYPIKYKLDPIFVQKVTQEVEILNFPYHQPTIANTLDSNLVNTLPPPILWNQHRAMSRIHRLPCH